MASNTFEEEMFKMFSIPHKELFAHLCVLLKIIFFFKHPVTSLSHMFSTFHVLHVFACFVFAPFIVNESYLTFRKSDFNIFHTRTLSLE